MATSVEAGSKTTSGDISSTSASASRAAKARKSSPTISLGAAIGSLATGLLHEDDVGDLDVLLESLDHVVDGQCRDARGGEGLHLHAGARGGPRLGDQRDEARARVDLSLHADEA